MKTRLVESETVSPGEIWPALANCQICRKEKQCLGFDTSREEHIYGFLCRECINEFLDKWKQADE